MTKQRKTVANRFSNQACKETSHATCQSKNKRHDNDWCTLYKAEHIQHLVHNTEPCIPCY